MRLWSTSGTCRVSHSSFSSPRLGCVTVLVWLRQPPASVSAQSSRNSGEPSWSSSSSRARPGVVGVAARHRAEVGHGLRCGGGALVRRAADRAPGRVGRVGQEPEPRLVAPLRAQPDQSPCSADDIAFQASTSPLALVTSAGRSWNRSISRSTLGRTCRSICPECGGGRAGEVEDVVALVGVETEGAAQRGQHLVRRLRPASLLEPDDVVDADPGQHARAPRGAAPAPCGAARPAARRPRAGRCRGRA